MSSEKMSLDQKVYNCAGVVLFNKDFTKIILVETEAGHYSFPKGKRDKNESIVKTAIRETEEETGIKSDQYLLSNFVLSEFKKPDSKTPSVLYFIGQLLENVETFIFDKGELKNVKWFPVKDALEIDDSHFKNQRKEVLSAAISEINKNDFRLYSLAEIEDSLKPKKKPLTDQELESRRLDGFSKLLSWILRHGIHEMGLTMNEEGYVSVDALLQLEKLSNLSLDDLIKVVDNNKKQRFKLIKGSDSKLFIRANQGHSANIGNQLNDDKMMKKISLCDNIFDGYHGTSLENWELIKSSGLKPCERKHCHLSKSYLKDKDTVISGIRDHSQVIIKVDIKRGLENGMTFYVSDNDVILVEFVPPELLTRIK
uniref:Nudix hydrolase domain-containing protein n=1 Tax=viral metagenome TaxID=1070528 RepID=A0A6C0E7Q8_9ZZZZ